MQPFNPYDKEPDVTLTTFRLAFGAGEDYEAELQLIENGGEWSGYLTFKSQSLSPDFPVAGVPFRYPTPPAGTIAQAKERAFEFWSGLVRVFRMIGFIHYPDERAA